MVNPKHLNTLKRGTHAWNSWRKAHPNERPDLERATIRKVSLEGVDLSQANLRRARFVNGRLNNANLAGADLREANLTGASLRRAKFARADLSGARLVNADLDGSDLRSSTSIAGDFSNAMMRACRLENANWERVLLKAVDLTGSCLKESRLEQGDFQNAILKSVDVDYSSLRNSIFGDTIFAAMDLSKATGLESAKHRRPSQISTDTIRLSRTNIPEGFFKESGMATELIEAISTILIENKPEWYHHAFISYAHEDHAFADRLFRNLRAAGVNCWLDDHNLRLGRPLHKTVDIAIHNYEKMILVLSKSSMGSSWVEHEVELALSIEHRGRQDCLIRIMIDDTVKRLNESWLTNIYSTRRVGDFRRWRDFESYLADFEKLLHALSTEPEDGVHSRGDRR
jgi:uncharacterized protein YjbI with pentapeptide repeats